MSAMSSERVEEWESSTSSELIFQCVRTYGTSVRLKHWLFRRNWSIGNSQDGSASIPFRKIGPKSTVFGLSEIKYHERNISHDKFCFFFYRTDRRTPLRLPLNSCRSVGLRTSQVRQSLVRSSSVTSWQLFLSLHTGHPHPTDHNCMFLSNPVREGGR